jgi:hypothetical protein
VHEELDAGGFESEDNFGEVVRCGVETPFSKSWITPRDTFALVARRPCDQSSAARPMRQQIGVRRDPSMAGRIPQNFGDCVWEMPPGQYIPLSSQAKTMTRITIQISVAPGCGSTR